MLSAGKGPVSRTFLNSIKEDEDMYAGAEMQQIKASFEDFSEVKPIGEGAFGKVLLVKQRETGELFAMKLMDKAKFKAQKITSKAVSEQYILKTTRFPFIVALQYAFQGSTFWALVMEYCPNGDLQDLLVKRGNPGLRLVDCARLGGEVLLALEHLHRIQVIFRDLKLENVVLCPKFRAKLTDFGLAKKLYTTSDARTMCGSYGYAAPEIMSNTGRYSYSVDLYSFGVMMYMLLSGGDQAPNNPRQRLPPMRHTSLRRKLREAERHPPGDWAKENVGTVKARLD
jgi:serine/threonine protein kinase